MEIKEAQEQVAAFAAERGWEQNLPTQRVSHLMREVGRMGEHTMFAEGMTTKCSRWRNSPIVLTSTSRRP